MTISTQKILTNILIIMIYNKHSYSKSGVLGLVDRVYAINTESGRFDSHWQHMSKHSFRSNRPGYPQPVCSELENSGIRVESAVHDCSVTESWRWHPPYQTAKTVHCAHKNTTNTTTTDAWRRVCSAMVPYYRMELFFFLPIQSIYM